MTDPEYRYLTHESVDEGTIVRIMLNRPDARNTQNRGLLVELSAAFARAEEDDAGLMLMWACDLILAAEGTTFADVVGTRLGMCGMEYFAHPWEFGPRKAKELLHHAHWAWIHDNRLPMGTPQDEGISDWRTSPQARPAAKNLVGAADTAG